MVRFLRAVVAAFALVFVATPAGAAAILDKYPLQHFKYAGNWNDPSLDGGLQIRIANKWEKRSIQYIFRLPLEKVVSGTTGAKFYDTVSQFDSSGKLISTDTVQTENLIDFPFPPYFRSWKSAFQSFYYPTTSFTEVFADGSRARHEIATYFFADFQTIESYDGSFYVRLSAVPEPATWAMMILGFGLAGAALRRRRLPSVTPA